MYLLGMYGASLDLASITKNFGAQLFTRDSYAADVAISSIRHAVPEDGSSISVETPVTADLLPALSLPVTNVITQSNPYYEAGRLMEVKVTTLPVGKGALYGQSSGGAWEEITAAMLPFSVVRDDSAAIDEELRYKVRYRPPENEFNSSNAFATFAYSVENTNGTTGVLSSTSSLFVTPVNDAPVPTQNVITKAIDWTKTASSEVFPRINFGTGATTIETGASELTSYSTTCTPSCRGTLTTLVSAPPLASDALQADYKYELTNQASIPDNGSEGNGQTALFTDTISFTLLDLAGAESFSSQAGSATVTVLNPLVGGAVPKAKAKWCINIEGGKNTCRGRLDCAAYPERYGLSAADAAAGGCKDATRPEHDDATWLWAGDAAKVVEVRGYDYGASAQPDTLGGRAISFQIKPGDLTSKGTLYQYTGDDSSAATMKGAPLVAGGDGYADVTNATLVGSNEWTGRLVFVPDTRFNNYPQNTGFEWQEYCLQWFVEQDFMTTSGSADRWLSQKSQWPAQCYSSVFSVEKYDSFPKDSKRKITGVGSTIVMPYRMKTGDGGLSPPVDHHLYVRAMPSSIGVPTLPLTNVTAPPSGMTTIGDCLDVGAFLYTDAGSTGVTVTTPTKWESGAPTTGALNIEIQAASKSTFSLCGFPHLNELAASESEGSGDWMLLVTKGRGEAELTAPTEYSEDNSEDNDNTLWGTDGNGLRASSSRANQCASSGECQDRIWTYKWCDGPRAGTDDLFNSAVGDYSALRAQCTVLQDRDITKLEFYGEPENIDRVLYGLQYQPSVKTDADVGTCENDVIEVVLYNTLLAVKNPLLSRTVDGNPYAPIKMRLNVTTCVKALDADAIQCTRYLFIDICSPKEGSDAECKAIGCRVLIGGNKSATLITVLVLGLLFAMVTIYLVYKTILWLMGCCFQSMFKKAKYDLKLVEEGDDWELEPYEHGLLTLQMEPEHMRKGHMHHNVKEGDYLKLELSTGKGTIRTANSMIQAPGTVDMEVPLEAGHWTPKNICRMIKRCIEQHDKYASYKIELVGKMVQMPKLQKSDSLRSSSGKSVNLDSQGEAENPIHKQPSAEEDDEEEDDFQEVEIQVLQISRTPQEVSSGSKKNPAANAKMFTLTPSSTRLARVLGLPFKPGSANNQAKGEQMLELGNRNLPWAHKGCFYNCIELPIERLISTLCCRCLRKKEPTYDPETYCEVYVGDLVKKGTGLGPWEPAWVIESRPQMSCHFGGLSCCVFDWDRADPDAIPELKNTKPKMRGKRFQSTGGTSYVFDEVTREPVQRRSTNARKHSIQAWWFERNKHMEAKYGGNGCCSYIPCCNTAELTETAWTGGGGCLCCAKKRHYIQFPPPDPRKESLRAVNPSGEWSEYQDDDGHTYYCNNVTKQTQWQKPGDWTKNSSDNMSSEIELAEMNDPNFARKESDLTEFTTSSSHVV
jgi:hypothetical protein